MRSVVRLFLLACASLLIGGGCAHYQLGTGAAGKLAFRTLYVAPVENRTLLPEARALVSTRLRETFARDGRVALADSPEAADATLTVTLVDYHRDVAAVREGDTGLARKFELVLVATCTLHDNRANRTLFENRPVQATREAFTDSGQLQAEYQTLPLLAESLADRIVHAALDIW
ncbi:MAG TPA: LPS assembly lipoprotein LptE [Opitutaceae bacterium]|nr:LPS assembly lipoprotein LptE [Opitutaceae bacterium]